MGTPIIYEPLKNAKRIKIFIPYELYEIRKAFKSLNSTYWHPSQKLWSIINTQENMALVKRTFKGDFTISVEKPFVPIKTTRLNEKAIDTLLELEKTLVLKHYGQSTINNYKKMLSVFLTKFMHQDLKSISKIQIEQFIYELIKLNNISESYQNQLINAIKAYYEHVLGLPREYYDIQRPKKSQNIPNVLSQEEVLKILQHHKNIKHKAILWTIYSAGLRISELINLRIADVHSDEGYLFIKDSKGKKDHKTILSDHLVVLLRKYYKLHKPSYWLFEGQTGGKYSTTSIRNILRTAIKETDSNPWATVHTLRHSFATHCIENNMNLRHLQNMLGHNSPKTTELYTKTIQINNKNISSPIDNLLKKL
ncbi:recombinase XerD [Aureibaculum algae]|uniref:Recombinase XerD n=1 Tax=Aureibaculum algae TaxID=2584122 RepID=A0A5B7TKY1_9FLAO|nr:tyrosine-type recombinase/integrase [Aureibaculum algae]QCX37299.1 recombinase XerD [Aureibaculum algae]